MKILFVSSKNKSTGISPIIKNQGDSLVAIGCDVSYFGIEGKGFWGYLKNLSTLRKEISAGKYDLIHAHYSYSGFLAFLASRRPIIVSLMGSDVNQASPILQWIIIFFNRYLWNLTIVKSERMAKQINFADAPLILANGVDLDRFKPFEQKSCRKMLGFNNDLVLILFGSDPNRREKNYKLAFDAVEIVKKQIPNVVLFSLVGIPNTDLVNFYNAADLLLFTSIQEGSPNVVKEAMACELPIVSTDVGDVSHVIESVEGCYLTCGTLEDITEKIISAVNFRRSKKFTKGRAKILSIGYDSLNVAHTLFENYIKILRR